MNIEIQSRRGVAYSAYIDGDFAGTCMVTRFNDGIWVSLLYVEPEFRRRGIATKLLDRIESEFKDKRFYLIPAPMYGSDVSLQDLVALYHRRGYKESHVHKPMLVLEPRNETLKAQQ